MSPFSTVIPTTPIKTVPRPQNKKIKNEKNSQRKNNIASFTAPESETVNVNYSILCFSLPSLCYEIFNN